MSTFGAIRARQHRRCLIPAMLAQCVCIKDYWPIFHICCPCKGKAVLPGICWKSLPILGSHWNKNLRKIFNRDSIIYIYSEHVASPEGLPTCCRSHLEDFSNKALALCVAFAFVESIALIAWRSSFRYTISRAFAFCYVTVVLSRIHFSAHVGLAYFDLIITFGYALLWLSTYVRFIRTVAIFPAIRWTILNKNINL